MTLSRTLAALLIATCAHAGNWPAWRGPTADGIDAEGEQPEVHSMHNMASPSCVTDGTFVYAWVATGQLVALDMKGRLVWARHLGKEYSHFVVLWGHGSSPLLYKNHIILLCD